LGTSRSSTTVLGSYTGKHPLTQISSEQISRSEYQDWLHVLSRSRTPAPIIDPNKPALLVRFFDWAINNIENALVFLIFN
jgi:hypothetical protein